MARKPRVAIRDVIAGLLAVAAVLQGVASVLEAMHGK